MEVKLTEKAEEIISHCVQERESTNPINIARALMHISSISMHGAEHHILDGAAMLTAMHNAGADFDLLPALTELANRAQKMPGAMCGYWGVCGATTSIGSALAIIHGTGPLSSSAYYKDNMEFVAKALVAISAIGGPRCCKRNAFISILTAIDFVKEKYHLNLEYETIKCEFSSKNQQCIGNICPFCCDKNAPQK